MIRSNPILSQIGPYPVVRPIARGGMAEVFEVTDPASGEHLALKLLVQTGTALPRFNREYEAMTRLNHPNIVRVFNYGFHEEKPWLTMELLDGVVLQSRVKSMGRPGTSERLREVYRVAFHLAEALQYIHERGLVHRDIKSANVLVLPDGRVKLLDFGTAHLQNPVEMITEKGEFVGTFAYASPEQLTGGVVDYRADLYSFGVLLYRLATGKRPFEANEPHALARMHVKQAPPPPSKYVPDLPDELEDLILWMLEKKADDRPQQAVEIAAALERAAGQSLGYLPGSGIAVRTDRPVGRDSETRAALEAIASPTGNHAILIVGGEGSGRLRFGNAVIDAAKVEGWRVLQVTLRRGKELRGFVDCLRNAALDVGCTDGPAVLRQHSQEGQLAHLAFRQEILLAAEACLLAVVQSANSPVVFAIQHLHRAGPVALELLRALQRVVLRKELAVRFLGSSDESVYFESSLLRRRWSEATRIELGALSPRGVAIAVGSMLDRRPPPAELARKIHQASGGQPGFVEEIVAGLVKSGTLEVHAGDGNRLHWAGGEIEQLPMPASARRAVNRGLESVPVAHRRFLEVLAVAGGEASLEVLGRSLVLKPRAVKLLLDALARSGWLRLESGMVYFFKALASEVILEQISKRRARHYERQLAQFFDSDRPTTALVRVLAATGDGAAAVNRGLECARALVSGGYYVRALEVLDLIAPLVTEVAGLTESEVVTLHLMHTTCMMAVKPADRETARSYLKAKRAVVEPLLAAEVAVTGAKMQWVIGHYPNFRKFLLQAWEMLPERHGGELDATIATYLAQSYLWAGQPRTAGEWYEKAKLCAASSGSAQAMQLADLGCAGLFFARGQLRESEEILIRLRAEFEAEGRRAGLYEASVLWAEVLRHQGRFSELLAEMYRLLPLAREEQSSSTYIRLLLITALCEVDLFRLGKAQECLDELDATVHQGEYLHLRVEAGLVRGRILMASGQFQEAEDTLREAHTKAAAAKLLILSEKNRAALAETLWLMGHKDESRDAFQSAILGLLGTGDISALSEACVARARVLYAEVDPDKIFQPVRAVVSNEPMLLIQMEEAICRGNRARTLGEPTQAKAHFRRALGLLNRLTKQLNDTDKAALRVHPWSQTIRLGLR